MLKRIAIALFAFMGAFVAVIALQPGEYRVERETVIRAPAADVFALVNGFRGWVRFSPWQDLDPNIKTTYSGPEFGVGAQYAWQGNDDVGQGKMAITESVENTRVVYDLEFIAPFQAKALTTMHLTDLGDSTTVRWTMSGDNNFIAKAFGVFVDMEGAIGADYEKGLRRLKLIVESEARTQRDAAHSVAAAPVDDAKPDDDEPDAPDEVPPEGGG